MKKVLAFVLSLMLAFAPLAITEGEFGPQMVSVNALQAGDNVDVQDVDATEAFVAEFPETFDDEEESFEYDFGEKYDASSESEVEAWVVEDIIAEEQEFDLVGEDEDEDAEELDITVSGAVYASSASALMEAASDEIPIDSDHFADAIFRTYVKAFDKDENGALSEAERNDVTDIDVAGKVTSLKGIGLFPNLQNLDCANNSLTELDVSGNAKLKYLNCSNNNLTALDISKCTVLNQLSCEGNKLTALDISNCASLVAVVDVSVTTPVYTDETILYGDVFDSFLKCDVSVTIKGGNPDTSKSTDTTENKVVTVTITKKKTKGTAYVGTTYQIDLGNYTGKKFKSSNKKVVKVSTTGLLTPKKAGNAKITFKVGKTKCTITLKVVDKTIPTSVKLNLSGTVTVTKGEKVTLTATIPEGTNSGIKWTSSNKKVATVSKGVVTFKKKGKVTITATATRGKKKAKVKFKVSN